MKMSPEAGSTWTSDTVVPGPVSATPTSARRCLASAVTMLVPNPALPPDAAMPTPSSLTFSTQSGPSAR